MTFYIAVIYIPANGSIRSNWLCEKKRIQSVGDLFPPRRRSIARSFPPSLFLSPSLFLQTRSLVSIFLRESVTRRFNLRNRDRQCRCSARCSTSMTIAGNFVRSVCVLLTSPASIPFSLYLSLNLAALLQPALIHVAIHPPCVPLSRRSRSSIQSASPNL